MKKNKLIEFKFYNDYIFEFHSDEVDFNTINVLQVHGNQVTTCSSLSPEADGILCSCGNCALAIKTADCLPIAVIGKDGHAVLHAGWRGLENKIIMNEALEKINPIHFIIGPHISKKSYEVSKEFIDHFNGKFIEEDNGLFHFSLLDCAKFQIKSKYPSATIDFSNSCTFLDNRYNSYRRNKTTSRNWNILKRKNHE